jgi:hypothetical protein
MLCNFQKKFINNEENNKIFEEKCETPLGYLNLTHIFEKNVKNSTYVKHISGGSFGDSGERPSSRPPPPHTFPPSTLLKKKKKSHAFSLQPPVR